MPPEPQLTPPPKINPPVFIWILIIVAALVGSFEVYKLYIPTQTGTDISNWKTYRNENYGIEFKYPSDWYVYGGSKQVPIIISSTGKPAPNGGPGEEIIVSDDQGYEIDKSSSYQQTINQILSTFKFTK